VALNGVGGLNPQLARVYTPPAGAGATARPDGGVTPASTEAAPVAKTAGPALSPAQATKAVATENAAAASSVSTLDDSMLAGLQVQARRAAAAAAQPGARLDLRL
jgi:hypothetical protein